MEARLGLRDSGPRRSLGLDIDFNSVESFELLRLCLFYIVGTKFIVVLITMEYNCCGAEVSGAETMSEVKRFDGVCHSVDSVIVAVVRRSVSPMVN